VALTPTQAAQATRHLFLHRKVLLVRMAVRPTQLQTNGVVAVVVPLKLVTPMEPRKEAMVQRHLSRDRLLHSLVVAAAAGLPPQTLGL
jgi:hypothetical protein